MAKDTIKKYNRFGKKMFVTLEERQKMYTVQQKLLKIYQETKKFIGKIVKNIKVQWSHWEAELGEANSQKPYEKMIEFICSQRNANKVTIRFYFTLITLVKTLK